MPFQPTLPRRCPRERKLASFLAAAAASLSDPLKPSLSPPAGAVPAAPIPAAYNALMCAYSRAGRPDEILRLFRSLPFRPTAPLFTTLISSLADSGRHRAARAAFSSLLVSGLPPTTSVLTALLKAHRTASVESVYHVFSDFLAAMAVAGCSADAAVYNCLISALCDFRRVDEASGVLDLMLDNHIWPTIRSYTTILRGYCEQGRILEAERQGAELRLANHFMGHTDSSSRNKTIKIDIKMNESGHSI
ncbi:pentatricopeptide repeat-containing protein At5g46100-like isoform X2 [Panicum virgatum]|uniref:pentatricopeptide repeat-containing protein At5g46100-like isoform X2 n=1 Tax=Panicum virgatum TaxID=38727 RepID=UPI0019D60A43|nr:pentatricopeptide repeat-containing protein At5g46100-like isoform X2 [Panicum virgatum]